MKRSSDATPCQWMYADSGTGFWGFHEVAHMNPIRWSEQISVERVIHDLRGLQTNRPIRLIVGSDGRSVDFKTPQETIEYLEQFWWSMATDMESDELSQIVRAVYEQDGEEAGDCPDSSLSSCVEEATTWEVAAPEVNVPQRPEAPILLATLDRDAVERADEDRFAVYVQSDRVDVAIRGTADLNDLMTDLKLVSGRGFGKLHEEREFEDAIRVIGDVARKHPQKRLFVHGHSLGGTKAFVAAVRSNEFTVHGGCLFNPGSGTPTVKDWVALGATVTAGVFIGQYVIAKHIAASAASAASNATSLAAIASSAASESALVAAEAEALKATYWFPKFWGITQKAAAVAQNAAVATQNAAVATQNAAAVQNVAIVKQAAAAQCLGSAQTKAFAVVPAIQYVIDDAARDFEACKHRIPMEMKAYHIFGDPLSAAFPFTHIMKTYMRSSSSESRHALSNF